MSANVIRAMGPSNKELADAISSYVTAIEKADWEKAYLLRSKRFQNLNPLSIFQKKIAQLSYIVKKYEVLSYYKQGRSCQLVVRIQDSFSSDPSYSVAWWGNTSRGWVCIDDGTMIFPFFKGVLTGEQLMSLLGEE